MSFMPLLHRILPASLFFGGWLHGVELQTLVLLLAVWMLWWWLLEVVPLAITSLLPLALSAFVDANASTVSSYYAHPLILLFLGGFLLAIAVEKTALHLRLSRWISLLAGNQASWQLAALMFSTALCSMVLSNTATAVLMLPVASALASRSNNPRVAPALYIGMAFAASIGGVATLTGTPPNAMVAAYLAEHHQISLSYADWFWQAMPAAALMWLLCWLWLQWQFRLRGVALTDAESSPNMPWTRAQAYVTVLIVLTAAGWFFRPELNQALGIDLNDTHIVLLSAVLLFSIRVNKQPILRWQDTEQLPWGVLLLFGGGMALAYLLDSSGVFVNFMSQLSALADSPAWLVIGAICLVVVLLSEVGSNTATAAAVYPIVSVLALALHFPPEQLLIPAAFASSFAFMLPIATPPNTLVFATGKITVKQLLLAGFVLDIAGLVVVQWCG